MVSAVCDTEGENVRSWTNFLKVLNIECYLRPVPCTLYPGQVIPWRASFSSVNTESCSSLFFLARICWNGFQEFFFHRLSVKRWLEWSEKGLGRQCLAASGGIWRMRWGVYSISPSSHFYTTSCRWLASEVSVLLYLLTLRISLYFTHTHTPHTHRGERERGCCNTLTESQIKVKILLFFSRKMPPIISSSTREQILPRKQFQAFTVVL